MCLEGVRGKIDEIDTKILNLLHDRMELGLQAKKFKSEEIKDVKRELEVIKHIRRSSHGLVNEDFAKKIFKDIISESCRLQRQDHNLIGFQGEHGAFGEVAIRALESSTLVPVPCMEFLDVFEGVQDGTLDLGIVPVENAQRGDVPYVNDLLINTDLNITSEIYIPVKHCLLALPGTDMSEIRDVYSHPHVLAQCHNFFAEHKDMRQCPYYDTAGAAKMLEKNSMNGAGVIASEMCAEIYNLKLVKDSIQDDENNITRFLVISKSPAITRGDKCTVMFVCKDEPGTLYEVLKIFADANINLSKIASRPVKGEKNRFAFIIDFRGSDQDTHVVEVLGQIEALSESFRMLGCY